MSRHTITHADEIFIGAPQAGGINQSLRGTSLTVIHRQIIEDAEAPDPDAIVEAVAVAAAGAVTLDGTLVSGGVATLDFARNISLDSANAGDTTQTATITGTDIVGNPQVEDVDLNGTTEVFSAKAFKTVTSVVLDGSMAGDLIVGTPVAGDTEFGLDVKLVEAFDVLHAFEADGTDEGGTFTTADATSPATATTGDTKGTYNPSNAPDGSVDYILYFVPQLTKEAYGANFTG